MKIWQKGLAGAREALKYTVALLIAVVTLLPFYVMVYVALNDPAIPLIHGVFRLPSLTLENVITAWNQANLGRALINSSLITLGGLCIVVLFGASAGYVFARYPNKFNRFWFAVFLSCMMVPAIINTVPLYTIMRAIGGVNQLWSMILL